MITFSDLEGRLDVLRVDDRCNRHGRYPVAKLIKHHGGDAKLGEWFSKLTKDCPQKNHPGADARPNWQERPVSESLTGRQWH